VTLIGNGNVPLCPVDYLLIRVKYLIRNCRSRCFAYHRKRKWWQRGPRGVGGAERGGGQQTDRIATCPIVYPIRRTTFQRTRAGNAIEGRVAKSRGSRTCAGVHHLRIVRRPFYASSSIHEEPIVVSRVVQYPKLNSCNYIWKRDRFAGISASPVEIKI